MSNSENMNQQPETDAYDDFVNEGGANFGELLKFNKGEWKCNDEAVSVGTHYAAHVSETQRGYVRFENGKPTEFRIGLVREGFKMPTRESLGDTDENDWPLDKHGRPKDPLVKQHFVPMTHLETGEMVCFVTGSMGGEQAVRELTRMYKSKARTSEVPIVSLQVDSYIHEEYGRVYNPIFKFEGWYDTGIIPPPPVMVMGKQLPAPAATPLLEKPGEDDPISSGPPKKAKPKAKAAKTADNSDMDDDIPF